MGNSNTWSDPRMEHPLVDDADPDVRAAAESIHANESLHRHDPRGVTCIYCALVASRAARVLRNRTQRRLQQHRATIEAQPLLEDAGALDTLQDEEGT